MRGKLLLLSLLLTISVAGAQARQEMEKVSLDQSGSTIQSFTTVDSSGPAMLDPTVPGLTIQSFNSVDSSEPAKLDPTVPVNANTGPGVVAVPEPRTIAMMILGSGCLGALTVLRRRRRS